MASPAAPTWNFPKIEVFRLTEIGLPEDILKIAQSMDDPLEEDLQRVEAVLRGYKTKLDAIRGLVAAEPYYVGSSASRSPMIERLWCVESMAKHRVYACINVRAAWRRIPVELWDRIFSHVVDALRSQRNIRLNVKTDASTLRMNAPAAISLVCKTWKAAVFATPSIWRDVIVLAKEDTTKAQPVIRAEDADLILSRLDRLASNSQLWDLTVKVCDGSREEKVSGISLPLLLRCHTALPFVERFSFTATRLSGYLCGLSLPKVTSMVMVASRNTSFNENPLPHFPQLSKAVFVDLAGQHELYRHLPYSQLTHLFLGKIFDAPEMVVVLRQCPGLRYGGFWLAGRASIGFGYGPLHPPPPPVGVALAMPHLVELIIVNQFFPNMSFQGLTFPNLVKMKIYCDVSLAEGQLRACPNITHLTLQGSRMLQLSSGLRDVIRSCPFLTELTAPWLQDVDSLVYDPKQINGQHLEILTLLHPGFTGSCVLVMTTRMTVETVRSTLVSIADSRRKATQNNLAHPCATLKQLTLRLCEKIDMWDNDSAFARMNLHTALRPHVETGLKLSIIDTESTELTGCPLSEESDFEHWDFGLLDFLE
ncbi:hypothetical protein NMY22_g3711 [Coprinellus aureogranulatus]|nr:hypothetical protein NMY22_g3711 [Coprinellus aureogranulatus]